MKKSFLLLISLFAAVTVCGQESGNRIYGNNGYYQLRRPQTNSGSLIGSYGGYAIEASVITNLKPDAFVVVFGVDEEATTSAASNEKVNAKVAELVQKLAPLGINQNDVFVDFITQNRVYDFSVSGTQATENLTGFQTKKTVAVRYKSRELFEKIVTTAARVRIFDLIKVDYIVSDFETVRARLFEAAVKIIKSKEAKYMKSLGVGLTPVGLATRCTMSLIHLKRTNDTRLLKQATPLCTARTAQPAESCSARASHFSTNRSLRAALTPCCYP